MIQSPEAIIQNLKEEGLYRRRVITKSSSHLLNFSRSDYLGLASDERVNQAFIDGFKKHPAGSVSSGVIVGYHPTHQALEETVAGYLEVDAALLFGSGYLANLAVMALLARLQRPLLIDKAVHASIYDGIKLAGAACTRYLHNDMDDFQKKLKGVGHVVVSEGIFSMSGQSPPLAAMAALCSAQKAHLIVDEAHAFGVVGKKGLGCVHTEGLSQKEVPLRMIMFGKAVGFQGAVVAGDRVWIDALLQVARTYIYTTAVSPALAYGLTQTLPLVYDADAAREKLLSLVAYFKKAITTSQLTWRQSPSAIQQLQLGCPKKAQIYADYLKNKGIISMPIRRPTVTQAETGLRIVLNANHSFQDIDRLMDVLSELD